MPESRLLLNNCIESANAGEDEQESAYNEPGMGLSTKSISKLLIGKKFEPVLSLVDICVARKTMILHLISRMYILRMPRLHHRNTITKENYLCCRS